MAKGKSIGVVGKLCVSRNLREKWDLRSWLGLMKPCWQSKFGDYTLTKSPYCTRCSAPSISLPGQFLKQEAPGALFAWQSLLKARHIIKKGMLWRVGDGRQIRVFHDNWIQTIEARQ